MVPCVSLNLSFYHENKSHHFYYISFLFNIFFWFVVTICISLSGITWSWKSLYVMFSLIFSISFCLLLFSLTKERLVIIIIIIITYNFNHIPKKEKVDKKIYIKFHLLCFIFHFSFSTFQLFLLFIIVYNIFVDVFFSIHPFFFYFFSNSIFFIIHLFYQDILPFHFHLIFLFFFIFTDKFFSCFLN